MEVDCNPSSHLAVAPIIAATRLRFQEKTETGKGAIMYSVAAENPAAVQRLMREVHTTSVGCVWNRGAL